MNIRILSYSGKPYPELCHQEALCSWFRVETPNDLYWSGCSLAIVARGDRQVLSDYQLYFEASVRLVYGTVAMLGKLLGRWERESSLLDCRCGGAHEPMDEIRSLLY